MASCTEIKSTSTEQAMMDSRKQAVVTNHSADCVRKLSTATTQQGLMINTPPPPPPKPPPPPPPTTTPAPPSPPPSPTPMPDVGVTVTEEGRVVGVVVELPEVLPIDSGGVSGVYQPPCGG
uniref:Uncharacterized protein n=1 Tax=Anopheles farauti TaxID=69004 RepID=A0A182QSF5_9DIPT